VQGSEVNVSQQAFDRFYLQRFALRIMPLSLAAVATTTAVTSMLVFWFSGQDDRPRLAVMSLSVVLMLVAAFGCRYFAQRGFLAGAISSTLAFGLVAATAGSWTAYLSGRGAVYTLHVSMMMLVVGAIIAPRFWLVVTSWFVIAGPVIFFTLIDTASVPHQSRILVGFIFTAAAATSLLYLLVSRVKWSYFRLLMESVERSRSDPLTGLNNRDAWMDIVHMRSLARTSSSPEPTVILYMDVDNLKQVNDERGHHEGDKLLVAIGEILSNSLGPNAILARFGGDEFVACLPGMTLDSTTDALQRVNTSIARHPHCIGGSLSAGVTELGAHESIGDALVRADENLLAIKKGRRNSRDNQPAFDLRFALTASPAD
jgi:diguanylate cyclase (GGDEF)-like protein